MAAAILASISLIFLFGFIRSVASQQTGNYLITVGDTILPNTHTLSCRNSDGDSPAMPLYFRNGDIFQEDRVQDGTLTFVLTRENEGIFRCGERTSSGNTIMSTDDTTVKLIPLPDGNLERGSFSANTGDTATINCPVVPGSCVDQYSVRWENASNTSQVFYEQSRFRTFNLSERYSLDAATFALRISSVQPSDGLSDYVCNVSVLINSQDHPYTASQMLHQSLDVFEAPAFVVTPRAVTIAENAVENARYECKVRSSPSPSSISWFHTTDVRTMTISRSNISGYRFKSKLIKTVEGYQVNSHLMVMGVRSGDTGTIVCRATYGGDVEIQPLEHSTTLTVISAPTALQPRRTDEGGFFYEIYLQRALPIPVQVDLWHTDADSGRQERSPSTEFFVDTKVLRIFRSSIPFRTSMLSARIVYGDEDVVGPFFNATSEFERSKMDYIRLSLYIAIGVAIVLAVALVLAIWVACAKSCKLRERARHPECNMGIEIQSNRPERRAKSGAGALGGARVAHSADNSQHIYESEATFVRPQRQVHTCMLISQIGSRVSNGNVYVTSSQVPVEVEARPPVEVNVRTDGSQKSPRTENRDEVTPSPERMEMRQINAKPKDSETSTDTTVTSRVVADCADSSSSSASSAASDPTTRPASSSATTSSRSRFSSLKTLLFYICCCIRRPRALYNHETGVSEKSADVYLNNLKKAIQFGIKDAVIGNKMKQEPYKQLVDFVNSSK